MTITDFLLGQYYLYGDSLNAQEWNMENDSTKMVLGHECQKATCCFRGRQWTAWFALDVPVSDGPWKFCGLPGLIMEVYDRGKQYYFCINGMQQVSATPITLGYLTRNSCAFRKRQERISCNQNISIWKSEQYQRGFNGNISGWLGWDSELWSDRKE